MTHPSFDELRDLEHGNDSGGGVFVLAILAAIATATVALIWLGLWAINKPVHPFACDQLRSECAAAAEVLK